MGFWSRFRGKTANVEEPTKLPEAPGAPPFSKPSTPDVSEAATERLARVGSGDGPTFEEAEALFASMRRTSNEAAAIEALMAASQTRRLPDTLLCAIAHALTERGEPQLASRVLAPATSSSALMMLADLAESRGDAANAVALIERVLIRDVDHPGARERHQRLRERLGYALRAPAVPSGATIMTHGAHGLDSPFELVREVGRGGAGTVYEARDRELGRTMALKVYHHHERDRAQLVHEARTAVRFAGAGVVRVYDMDPEQGWLVLEWAPSGTLKKRILDRAPSLVPIERWALPLAEALARVHHAGFVHHDVKPANVLLTREGAPLLTDFGTARAIGSPSPEGSLGYVSPERAAGRSSDPRDDVYGFGRILEDVLDGVTHPPSLARWRSIAAACTGPDHERPKTGEELRNALMSLPSRG